MLSSLLLTLALAMPAQAEVTATLDGWQPSVAYPNWLYHWEGGKLRAGYEPVSGKYMIHLGDGRWMSAEKPKDLIPNFGLDTSRLSTGPDFSINGRPTTKDEAMRAIEGTLTDDRAKHRLTVIGDEASRKQVTADLDSSPALADYKGKLLVQAYDPTNWAAAKFQPSGNPTILVQAPDGQVLHRQDDYRDGAVGLAKAIAGSYDPRKDKDLRKPQLPNMDAKTVGIGGGALALILFLLFGKGKVQAPAAAAPPPIASVAPPPPTVETVTTATTAAVKEAVNPLLEMLRGYAADRDADKADRTLRDAQYAEVAKRLKELTTAP